MKEVLKGRMNYSVFSERKSEKSSFMACSIFYHRTINIGQDEKDDIGECKKTQSIMYNR